MQNVTPAIKRRQLVDSITAFVVRAMSLLVLAAVVGMLIQLLMAVVPLAKTPKLEPSIATHPAPVAPQIIDSAPEWLPSYASHANWQVAGDRGMWFIIDENGVLNGQILHLPFVGLDSNYYEIPPLKVSPDTQVRLVNSPRDSLSRFAGFGCLYVL